MDDLDPPGPEWVRAFLDNDYYATVNYVVIQDRELKDIAPLAKLKHLEILYLDHVQVSDLTPLVKLKSLTHLIINNTQVSNLSPLAGMASLEYLELVNTAVTQEQINELKKALPNCYIDWTPPDKSIEGN